MADTLAAAARRALRERPFLADALRAGGVNYAAAARFVGLDDDADADAAATALRRHAASLSEYETTARSARVTMTGGLGRVDASDDASDEDAPLVSVNGAAFAPDAGSLTGVVAVGDVDADALATALSRLRVEGVTVQAAGVTGEGLVVVVDRRDGPDAVRAVESALERVPVGSTE